MTYGQGVELRVAGAADVEAAVAVWQASLGGRGLRPNATRIAQVTLAISAPDALVVMAHDDGVAVGMALGEPGREQGGAGDLVPDLLHLSMLYVVPGAQRAGLGGALVEGIADAAWARGARRVSCWTPVGDAPIGGLLAACGLERSGRVRGSAEHWTAELEAPVRDVVVTADGIRLGQLLKLAGLVDTGSQAKELLAAGEVQVDGEVDVRRGRQLLDGQVVTARDQAVRLVLDGPEPQPESRQP